MTLPDLLSLWPVLASLLGAVAVAAVAVVRAGTAVETATRQAAEIVALREAAAANKADHAAIMAQLARLETAVGELLRGSRA
jgi:hypothetical protein